MDPVALPNIGRLFPSNQIDTSTAATSDITLSNHCRKYGEMGYSFITYPVGGLNRYQWKPMELSSKNGRN